MVCEEFTGTIPPELLSVLALSSRFDGPYV